MSLQPVTILNVLLAQGDNPLPVGRLALKDRRVWFEYDAAFLRSGLEISPYKLPLKAGVVPCDDMVFEGLFGVFNDSLPDGWGRLLLDRHMRSLGIAPQELTVLDRLAYVGQRGMGGLIYRPDHSLEAPTPETLDLDRLAEESRKVLDGTSKKVLEELLSLNGSSSGARPKVMVGVGKDKKRIVYGVDNLPEGYDHWLVKFIASADSEDNGAVEYAYSLMARAAGIDMPETHLFPASKGAGYFGVKRFDRKGNGRIHMHTVSGLLHADHRSPSLEYEEILKATRWLTKSMPEVEAFFRLAVFNVLTHNRDDHAKNFAFLMGGDGTWRTAPAYDLTFSSGPAGEHSTTVMGEGRNPSRRHLQQLGTKFGIKRTDEIIDQVLEAVNRWKEFASEAGVGKDSLSAIAKSILRINASS